MAVHADHALLVMDIRTSAIFSSEFRIDPSSMAKGACLSLVPLHEPVAFDQTKVNSADHRTLDVAVPTGRMAAPAGFLKDLLVENLQFVLGEPGTDTMS
jgi:hypothetical protein